jgi:hypothetical protein
MVNFVHFRSFSGNEQADFRNSVVTLDPLYNVVWSYDNSSGILQSYNPVTIVLVKSINTCSFFHQIF